MTDKQQTLDTLRGENFSEESGLSRVNKRIISKMFRYIGKFPLEEVEVEQIRKDIIGVLVFHLFWVGLYIVGARKNKVNKQL